MLDVGGKVIAKVMQMRLQKVGEEAVFEESQAGFRAWRGCMDMIFACRQLVEKLLEQKESAFLLFICLLYTSPSPRDQRGSRMPSSA